MPLLQLETLFLLRGVVKIEQIIAELASSEALDFNGFELYLPELVFILGLDLIEVIRIGWLSDDQSVV